MPFHILDVQCFDLGAVESIKNNPKHQEISAIRYASPLSKSSAVDNLDVVILGATQVDTQFNVNVHTKSNGIIMGGSGGHTDCAEGAKISMILLPLIRKRTPMIVDRVNCISTPGNTVDLVVTQYGIAVNPLRKELKAKLKDGGLPILDIEELKNKANSMTGIPEKLNLDDKIVGYVMSRRGQIQDELHKVK